MDWDKGFKASYYATIVDPTTWEDTSERIEITGGTIKHTDSDLLESADVNTSNYELENEKLIRVWLDTVQANGNMGHTPLFTGIASTPSVQYNGYYSSTSIQCYSVLKSAQDMLLPRGWYAPVDIPGSTIIKELFSPTNTIIDFAEETARLQTSILAEDGENRLTMAWKIADALGWILQIKGDGTVLIGPPSNNSKWEFNRSTYDIIETSLDIKRDWFDCPNVLRVVLGDAIAIAKDEDPNSIFSTVSRGREIWAEQNDVVLSGSQTLGQYAMDTLKSLQDASLTVNYDRRYVPDIMVGDIVTLYYPDQSLTGQYLITSQSINLAYNAKVSEEVIKL